MKPQSGHEGHHPRSRETMSCTSLGHGDTNAKENKMEAGSVVVQKK